MDASRDAAADQVPEVPVMRKRKRLQSPSQSQSGDCSCIGTGRADGRGRQVSAGHVARSFVTKSHVCTWSGRGVWMEDDEACKAVRQRIRVRETSTTPSQRPPRERSGSARAVPLSRYLPHHLSFWLELPSTTLSVCGRSSSSSSGRSSLPAATSHSVLLSGHRHTTPFTPHRTPSRALLRRPSSSRQRPRSWRDAAPTMDSKREASIGDGMDWSDISMFTSSQFDDGMPAESPFGNSAFNDFTNLDAYDSPAGLMLRTPSKSGPDPPAVGGAQSLHHQPNLSSASAETSSQDSASDSSSRRKRKTDNSESPVTDKATELGKRDAQSIQHDSKVIMVGEMQQVRNFESTFSQPMHNLSLEHTMSGGVDSSMGQFDFNSAASSPVQTGDFNAAMSLDAHVNMTTSSIAAQYQDSPVQTINPGSMFTVGGSRDQSPATKNHSNMMFSQPSPNAIFSTPSSDNQDFANPNWNTTLAQNPAWPGDYANQLTSPAGMTFTPSPVPNGNTPAASACASANHMGRSPLHIAPISTKSRVETQINLVMSLEKPPPGIEQLHLPLHTIAKSKLLAKEDCEKSRVLELHTMLVCSSAMHNLQYKEKAMQRAAAANNDEIQRRAEQARDIPDEEKNDPKNVEESDKPANGGEVKICSNCIQRERKRAGRKKTKREEEQQHWERFETERVVVFNSNEYLPFKPCDPTQIPQREGEGEQYMPPDGALCVTAAMRIACYCRHQSEKEGFRVIFTLKDHLGNVVAQQMSDSILITDDHKTHPQSFPATVASDGYYQGAGYLPSGLPISHSMVDMTAHAQPFTSSRSAGNLTALYNNQQYNSHSHIHQLPQSGYASGTTSATMTPTSLSRPGSPSSAGQAGPNKKRKSSTVHRKVPSGLTMTPRVDTSQSPSSNMPSAISMSSQFSPTSTGFGAQVNPSYMTIPNNSNGSAQYFGSGPPTPNESGPFNFAQPQADMSRVANNQAYFSHPSSAVPSRSSSPVLQQTRANMAAYARQQPIQTPTNSINARPAMYGGQATPTANAGEQALPIITKITPNEGPAAGGTEVAILGDNFVVGMSVQFGDLVAQTSWVSSTALLAISPQNRPGSVHVSLIPPQGQGRYPEPPSRPVFRYYQNNDEMMVMALKFLSEQYQGNVDNWQSFAQQSATNFVQSRINRAGLQQQGYPAGYRMTPNERRDEFAHIILNTQRQRRSRSSLQTHPSRGSTAFSDASWETARASTPAQQLQGTLDLNVSRTLASQFHGTDNSFSTSAGWSQQQSIHTLSSWRSSHDVFSRSEQPSLSQSPPPAYHELSPKPTNPRITRANRVMRDAAVKRAVADAVADEKCAFVLERCLASLTATRNASPAASIAEDAYLAWLVIVMPLLCNIVLANTHVAKMNFTVPALRVSILDEW